MGFFSKLFSETPVRLTIHDERDAYASILLACMHSDGDLSEEEKTVYYNAIAQRPFFTGRDVISTVMAASNNLEKAGSSSAVIDAAIEAITEKVRLPLFVNCVDLILSDGQVTRSEEEILDYLKTKFKVDDALAGKVIEVLILKNKV